MFLRIHICKSEASADALIAFLQTDPDFGGQNLRKMIDPDIMVRDHSENLAAPTLVNFNKVCVVYEE